ncbi:polygalacturonase-like [Lycium ferocissimum]|uniref:polygalacturonase-like n=1 Tax=Lycium ferocissimum TaxID=112874 RepID=UPI002815C856|nr:polygalacturonase-like [Lycium ferocissimum]
MMCKLSLLAIFPLFLIFLFNLSLATNTIYNVQNYGAKSNGKTDSSNAFLSAWSAACASTSAATIYVPRGSYLIRNAYFRGETCKSNVITIRIDGTLLAPSDYNVIGKSGNWIKFEKVTGVSIYGGTFDGQGAGLWACKTSGKKCPKGTTALAFYNSDKIIINGITAQNSQMFHILVDGCHNVKLQGVRVSAPGNSPNTDGIHVQSSSGVSIMNSRIGTGDDCISIGPGNSNLWIESIACGPGHGISIGSLGWKLQEAGVQNVTVKTVTFTGTDNGVRVKTWARPSSGFVRGVLFQHIVMANVQNPILIDQNYCPNHESCPHQGSGVKISDVTYQDIHGTSATEVAVKLDCSKTNPCTGITLEDVKLSYKDGSAKASCVNAGGRASGFEELTGCL